MAEPQVISRATSALSMRKDVNINYTELQDYDDLKRQPIHNDNPSAFRAWPTQPKPLVPARRDQLLYNALDFLLIVLPVCLIIKTGLCIYAHKLDQGNTGVYIDQASAMSRVLIGLNSQLVTLFTIVFATIVSIFMKRYALWKAQHGAYVADLEQFQGSVSLPSTLKLIWSLRSFGVRSIVLTSLWSFYYLGSQAVKLEYRLTLSNPSTKVNAAVPRSDSPSYFSPDLDQILNDTSYETYVFKGEVSYLDRLNTNFGSIAINAQDQGTGVPGTQPNYGTMNGPLIPDYYASLSNIKQTSLVDKFYHRYGRWIDVSKQSAQQGSYVSLTGQAIWIDQPYWDKKNYTHTIESVPFLGSYTLLNISYLNVSCDYSVVHPIWAFPNGTSGGWVSFNMTTLSPNTTKMDRHGYPLREFDYWVKLSTVDPIGGSTNPLPNDYNGTLNYTLRALQTTCNLTTRYVDMEVSCLTTGCYPSRLRWANKTDELHATGYSTPFDNDGFAANFFSNYTTTAGPQSDINSTCLAEDLYGVSSVVDQSIWSTPGPAKCIDFCESAADMAYVTQPLGPRLAKGFNTYYMLSQAVVSNYIQPNTQTLLSKGKFQDSVYRFVEAKGAPLSQAYRIYWQWVPVDFVACSILLALAIGAYWLRINTLAPDIFGYVSSLTRDNPHLRLPMEGSALSGVDRARMLKGVKVRIGDVQTGVAGESGIGRIGLAPVNADVRPLYGQRVYV